MTNWKKLEESFNFLNEYKFKGPIIYPNGVEVNFDYISPYSIVNITYEPGHEYVTRFIKLKSKIKTGDLEKIRWRKLEKSAYKIYNLDLFLDPKNKLKKSIQGHTKGDKNLEYYSTLLKSNPKMLNHNYDDFKTYSLIIKIFR
ncbi:hypothetical protein [Muriicola jejuensis]|uniref:Uncharacterized protein n=1 Tax=Muriicola jejuensis TaxID=504488 RepID=A0A6P0UIZ4_9FLAO|nr:hypothetical protein [Muriicola jejuensis]NER11809.1 hypothetical protein [Muriicola jejuensis]